MRWGFIADRKRAHRQRPQLPSLILSYQASLFTFPFLGGRYLRLESLLVLVLFILFATTWARHQQ